MILNNCIVCLFYKVNREFLICYMWNFSKGNWLIISRIRWIVGVRGLILIGW